MITNSNETVRIIMNSLGEGVEIEEMALIASELPTVEASELSEKIRAQENLTEAVRILIEAISSDPDSQRTVTFEFNLRGILRSELDGIPFKPFQ